MRVSNADKAELEGANHPRKLATGLWGRIGVLFWQGGSKYDAFLVAASAQVCMAFFLHEAPSWPFNALQPSNICTHQDVSVAQCKFEHHLQQLSLDTG